MINSASLTSPSDIAKDGRVEPGHDEQRSVPEMMREIVGGGRRLIAALPALGLTASPAAAQAPDTLDLTTEPLGILALAIFIVGYALVVLEETTHMRKSKPVLVAAGLIWAVIGFSYSAAGRGRIANEAAAHTIFEFGELFLFLLVAITYVNTLEERRVFEVLRARLAGLGLSYRGLFWLTGVIAFFLSAILDNLTTVLVMGAVVLAIGRDSSKFLGLACINLVVAANAGGAFSPFGDITTLMVWQKGKLEFFEFFQLFVPAVVSYLMPAAIIHFALPRGNPEKAPIESA